MADAPHPPHRHISPQTIRFCPLCGAGLAAKDMEAGKRPEMVCTGCEFIFYMPQKVVAVRICFLPSIPMPRTRKWTADLI